MPNKKAIQEDNKNQVKVKRNYTKKRKKYYQEMIMMMKLLMTKKIISIKNL